MMIDRRFLWVAVAAAALGTVGCAPKTFEQSIVATVDQYHVRDGAARRVEHRAYLRFNELILSDLDDAITAGKSGNPAEMRRLGTQAVRAAYSLGESVAGRELERLPAEGRTSLARSAGIDDASAASLQDEYRRRADASLEALLSRWRTASDADCLADMRRIRDAVEPLPDDQGRLGRQILFGWAALPAWMGVSSIESSTQQKHHEGGEDLFAKGATWAPNAGGDAELARCAPLLVMETPDDRDYPADYDRFGEVFLTGDPAHIDVHVNASHAVIYAYRSEAKIHGRRYPQLVYVWWFPQRPAMEKNDPEAGHIDGDTLRITLDHANRPGVIEVVQGCGCGHLVYVARAVEEQARAEFGAPPAGKDLAVERDVKDKRDLIVAGILTTDGKETRPVVYIRAGYHDVATVECHKFGDPLGVESTGRHIYDIDAYDQLDHLRLGTGYGSMFGPDGLVHNAGRSEGYLLAPTGMLSAGQPRKRGTQKIRWDEYSFDDPHLLDRTLRLPSDF